MWNPFDDLKVKDERFLLIYRAEVIDTNDSMSAGRVKVRVWPMMKDITTTVLPWATPAFGLFEGGEADVGAYTVPGVGSHVFVFFEAGDVQHPVYFASAPAAVHGPSGKTPGKKIWKTKSGVTIEIDGDGNITIETSGDVEAKGGGVIITGNVVTTRHQCAFTGGFHPFGSQNVKASQ